MEQSVSEKLKACFSFPLDWLVRLGMGVGWGTGHLERVLELDSVIKNSEVRYVWGISGLLTSSCRM